MPDYVCQTCSGSFSVPTEVLAKYPNWNPKQCFRCRKPAAPRATTGSAAPRPSGPRASSREENLTTAEVLEKYTGGPSNGVFTDGSAEPNPGPGGWGAVYVVDGVVVAEANGHDPMTTNNRMELSALIAATKMVPRDARATIYTDSELCVKSITIWAKAWKAKGWTKKGGPIKNLELVQELYDAYHSHPGLTLEWIKAHAGSRWNEYADSLASAYRRDEK